MLTGPKFQAKFQATLYFYLGRATEIHSPSKDFCFCACVCQGFLSQTLTLHRTAGKGKETSFIPLYHFRPFTRTQTFIRNFSCKMITTYFYRINKNLQLPDSYSMRFTQLIYHLIDWWWNINLHVCLFYVLILGFYYSNLT